MKVKGTTTIWLKGLWTRLGSGGLGCTCYPGAQKGQGAPVSLLLCRMSGVLAGNSCRTCMERRMVTAFQNSGEWVSQPDQTIKCAPEPKKQRSFLFSSVSCWASWSPQGLIGKTEYCSDMLGPHESSLWMEPWVLPMNKVGFVMMVKKSTQVRGGRKHQWWYKLLTVHPNLWFFHHEEISWRQTAQWATAWAPQVGRGIQQWLLHPRQEVVLPHGTPCPHPLIVVAWHEHYLQKKTQIWHQESG